MGAHDIMLLHMLVEYSVVDDTKTSMFETEVYLGPSRTSSMEPLRENS